MRQLGASRRAREPSGGAVLAEALALSASLAASDVAAIEAAPFSRRTFHREAAILQAGDAPADLYVVLSGVAARVRTAPGGDRQILAFLVPGDAFDWPLFRLNDRPDAERTALDHAVVALGECVVGMVRHEVLRQLLAEFPAVAEAFERQTLRDQAIMREWIVNLGLHRASMRLGHLVCELYARLAAAGQVHARSCLLPLTQVHLAEALGLSNVHVNRELQSLRAEGLVRLNAGVLTLPDPERLKRLCAFSGAYLHGGRARGEALANG